MPELGPILDMASWVLLALGGFFFLVGMLGLNRMPDVFTRMHAVSVSETLGVGLLVLGMLLQVPDFLVAVKLVVIFLVLVGTAPVATHALARAALHDGEKPLIADETGAQVPTDCARIFPELAERLEQPLSSEPIDGTAEEGRRSNS